MADTVKELVAKWSIQKGSWTDAIKEIRTLLSQTAKEDAVRAAAAKKAQDASLAAASAELNIRKQISSVATDNVKNESAKSRNAREAQAAAAQAAQQQLTAINQQIAAEKLKTAAIQRTIAEQKRAATEAKAFAAAYQAQVNEVAKNKAKADAIFDAAYKAQVAEVEKNKTLGSQSKDTRSNQIPIVTADNVRVPLNAENEGMVAANAAIIASTEAKTAAVVTSEQAIAEATTASSVVVDAAAKRYVELMRAETLLAAAKENVAEVEAAVSKGIMSEAKASEYLTQDLLKVRNATIAAAEAEQAYKIALNKPGVYSNKPSVPNSQLAQHRQSDGISQARKTKDTIDFAMGRATIGPIDALASKIPGLNTLIATAFPIVGIALFLPMITEGITKFVEMKKRAKEAKEAMVDSFSSATLSLQEENDKLKLTNDTLANTIAKLEHKPVNNVALAIDEARIKADTLAKSAMTAYTEVKKLLDENGSGTLSEFLGKENTERSLDPNLVNQIKQIKDAAREYQQAMKSGNTSDIALKLQKYNSAKVNAAAYAEQAQKNLDLVDQTKAPIDPNTGRTSPYTRDVSTAREHVNFFQDYIQGINDRDQGTIQNEDLTNKKNDLEARKQQNEIALKDAQADLEERKALAADALEDARAKILEEESLNTKLYKSGEKQASIYYDTKKKLSRETYDATIKDIKADIAAQKEDLKLKLQLGEITPHVYKAKNNALNYQSNRRITQAGATRDRSYAGVDEEANADRLTAVNKAIDDEAAKRKANLALATDAVRNAYAQQVISAEEYLQTSQQIIAQELASVKAQEATKQAIGKQTETATIASIERINKATEAADKKLQDLEQSRQTLLLESATSKYGRASTTAGLLTDVATSPNSNASLSDQIGIQSTQAAALNEYRLTLVKILATSESNSKVWQDTYQSLLKANAEAAQLADHIDHLHTSSGKVGDLFQAGSSALGGVFTSRYARGVESAIGSGGASASGAAGYVSQMTSGSLSNSSGVGDIIDVFSKRLTGAVGALGSFISSINSAGSASAGAFGGAISGGGLGNEAGKAVTAANDSGKLGGGALSSIAGALGPFGALIGAGIGTAVGAVFGQKQETVQNDVDLLNASFKKVMDSYSSNNSSLASTITSLQSLIAQAQADMASTKKGGSQFKDLINQYNQQIIQLEQQQAQIMADLNNQLIQISSPQAYQPLISSIQDVIKQYTSYVGAAQNATELANANNYLTQSLANLGQSYSQTLMQNQETAIQDALQLNDLYNQRNQLEQTYLSQVASIQGQGTLTRGITKSQSKYSQLYNLDVNQAVQLDAINQQIALEQYKVTAESKLFSLATTRIGLESQLLGLQEQGVNLDMNRIAAMQNVLQLLQTTGYSLTNLGSLNTSDPNALLTALLTLLAGQLGVNVGGANNTYGNGLDAGTASSYSTRAAYGYGAFRGANL